MDPGVYSNIPADDYHADDAMSTSGLKVFAKAPAKYRYGERKETDSLKLGTMIHDAVLEPHQFDRRYVATSLERRGTKAWEAEEQAAAGRIPVKTADWEDAQRIRDALYRHPVALELLSTPGPVEESFWWIDSNTGAKCRGRADKIATSMRVIVDIKSTVDASPDGFQRTVEDYKYDWQAAQYVDGLTAAPGGFQPEAFVFLAIEKEPPFLVGCYELMPEEYERARGQIAHHLARYVECLGADVWPGYSSTLEAISLNARRAENR